jgi:hypothetical protein
MAKMSCGELREWVAGLIQALDALDEVDYFGSEGWRSMLLEEGTDDGDG